MKLKTKVKQKGSIDAYIKRMYNLADSEEIRRLAEFGLNELIEATPVETGLTASSWSYKIEKTDTGFSINYYNDNMTEGVPVIILLQYGHVNHLGKYCDGTDIVNPVINGIFDDLVVKIKREASR